MTLTAALDIAKSSLAATAEQTAIVSRNAARGGDIAASRKLANLVTVKGGGVQVASITRATDRALFESKLSATSSSARQSAIAQALDQLEKTVGDPELDASPAALLGKLGETLQLYASSPDSQASAAAAVEAARRMASALNSATETTQSVRQQADSEIKAGVDQLNSLLSKFSEINAQIVKGTRAGADITDQLDSRDTILTRISELVGIRTMARSDNDVVIFTDSGVTLFETVPRLVDFLPTENPSAGAAGNSVLVDGVPITGSGSMITQSGRLSGLAAVRDDLAVKYQTQLDEIARGLIEAFAESDQRTPPLLPNAAGLFTYPGAPAIPASGAIASGLAGEIRISANVDPDRGGDPTLLRDGGISYPSNPAYVYNPSEASGFSTRLQQLIDGLSANRSFDVRAGLGETASLLSFSSSSVSWLEEGRSAALREEDYRLTVLSRSTEALSAVTGINLDEEMSMLLQLERSYQASSRLISTIDRMFEALLKIAG